MREDRGEDKVKIISQDSEQIFTEKEQDKTNTFNIIIGVSTLLVAILGATFAYFSATAKSKENDVTVKSAYVSISYDGGTEVKASNLIPATQTVALTKFKKKVTPIGTINDENLKFIDEDLYTVSDEKHKERRCIDDKGRQVCYVYQFTITSDGGEGVTDILGYIKVNENQFQNLSYLLYEVFYEEDENGQVMVDAFGDKVIKSEEENGYLLVSQFDEAYGRKEDPEYYKDNLDYVDTVFATFENKKDVSDGNVNSTVYPVACLFGFSDKYGEKDMAIDDPARCAVKSISNQVSHTYQLVIWLEETWEVQPEQGLIFQGTVAIEVPGGVNTSDYEDGKITGKN